MLFLPSFVGAETLRSDRGKNSSSKEKRSLLLSPSCQGSFTGMVCLVSLRNTMENGPEAQPGMR